MKDLDRSLLGGSSIYSMARAAGSALEQDSWGAFETMMQLFAHCTVQYGDKPARGFSITCGKCAREEKVPFSGAKAAAWGKAQDDFVAQQASRKFEALGWKVGKNPSQHRCPICIREGRAAQMRFLHAAKPSKQTPEKEKEKPVSAKVIDMPPSQPHAEPPREMTRDDRRIVFAKLQEAYGTETTGYTSGWTDERVATDLGVPLAWVHEMRNDYFGPLGSNPEIDRLVEEAKEWRRELISMVARADQLLLETRKLAGRGEYVERRLAELLKAVGR